MISRSVMVSGGFDPIHPGHLMLMYEAKTLAGPNGIACVVVDSDEYVSSKHKLMMCQEDRASIVGSSKHVDQVLWGRTKDGNCSELLIDYKPDIYLVGPDHSDHSLLPEFETCQEHNIHIRTAQFPRACDWHSSHYAQPKWVNPVVTVSCLLKNLSDEVLVSVRGIKDGLGLLELPGGFLEINEDLEEGVRREVREELRVGISQLEYFGSFPGKYSDGRDILSVYFHGYVDGVIESSKESLASEWYRTVPGLPFFNETDKQALSEFLGDR